MPHPIPTTFQRVSSSSPHPESSDRSSIIPKTSLRMELFQGTNSMQQLPRDIGFSGSKVGNNPGMELGMGVRGTRGLLDTKI